MEMETLRMMRELTEDEKKNEGVAHALQVRRALAQGNYGRFFKLYQTAPNMGVHLMDIFIDKHRIMCLQRMALASQTSSLEIARLANILAFDDSDSLIKFLTDIGKSFLRSINIWLYAISIGCIFVENPETGAKQALECRQSLPKLKAAPLKVKRCVKWAKRNGKCRNKQTR